MSRKVEAIGIIDAAGKLVAIFPVGLKHRYLAPHPGDRKVKFVPFDPDAARVLRLAVDALREINIAREALKRGHNLTAFATLEDDDILEFEQAVERRQKRGAK